MKKFNIALAIPMVVGLGALSACADNPPQATTTTTETVQSATPVQPAPMAQPGMPGTTTTQTTHSVSVPAQ